MAGQMPTNTAGAPAATAAQLVPVVWKQAGSARLAGSICIHEASSQLGMLSLMGVASCSGQQPGCSCTDAMMTEPVPQDLTLAWFLTGTLGMRTAAALCGWLSGGEQEDGDCDSLHPFAACAAIR